MTKMTGHVDDNKKKLKELEAKHTDLTSSSADAAKRREEVKKELEVLDMKLQAAQSDQRRSKREQKMLECVETLRRLFPGVRGRLYELCDLTRKEYKMAVTIALGKNMEVIVVDEEKVALDCIKYMKELPISDAEHEVD